MYATDRDHVAHAVNRQIGTDRSPTRHSLPGGSFTYSDGEFAAAMALVRERDLTWAAGYPLASGAAIFTELMNGRVDPVKALLRP
jgi:hypothetical protein